MSIVAFVNFVELMKYIASTLFRTFYSHVLKPTSLFHLEEMFLFSYPLSLSTIVSFPVHVIPCKDLAKAQ